MSGQDLRLEILKLVHRHDLTPEAIIPRAKAFLAFVEDETGKVETPPREVPPSPPEPRKGKKTGKPDPTEDDILS